jgi:hypothetical protein
MKKFIETLFCVFAIVLIIAFPSLITESVKSGITLCLYTLIPALLPFLLIVNSMQKYNLCSYLSYITKPFLKIPFKLSDNGCFAVIIGFSCGYPMGAKTISDLYTQQKITLSEASYLITFCNNCSLSFLINYIYLNYIHNTLKPWRHFSNKSALVIFLVYTPAILTGIINRFFMRPDIRKRHGLSASYIENPILSSVKSLVTLSIYVICFTVLSRLISVTAIHKTAKAIICGISEITSGTVVLASTINNSFFCTYLILLCTVFGGLSITMQSLSQIKNKSLKKYYLIGKIENIIFFTLLFMIIYFVEKL